MVEFRYPPIIVPVSMPDDVVFVTMYTAHYRWLHHQGATFTISSYRWPEILSRLLSRHIGTVVCELQVSVADEFAKQFGRLYPGVAPGSTMQDAR